LIQELALVGSHSLRAWRRVGKVGSKDKQCEVVTRRSIFKSVYVNKKRFLHLHKVYQYRGCIECTFEVDIINTT
jgi:hypothetical protein